MARALLTLFVQTAVPGSLAWEIRRGLRPDGSPFYACTEKELRLTDTAGIEYPFSAFSASYVQAAMSAQVDWRSDEGGKAVTPAKNQGGHPYCGTFSRAESAEGQYGLRSGRPKRNFSVEQLVDCYGWDLDQSPAFFKTGFESWEDYPYNMTAPSGDPGKGPPPCSFKSEKVIPASTFSNHTTVSGSAGVEQLAAFIHHNGPVGGGIDSGIFYLAHGSGPDTFVNASACRSRAGHGIDHAIVCVGYGTDAKVGDYWLIKNSWGVGFGDQGFIKIARGINCGNFESTGAGVYTYGDPATYYETGLETSDVIV